MIGNDGKVKEHYWQARENGIIMDVGHGNNSFSFSMAVPAIEQGFPPDTISTDMHRMSLHTSRATMTEVMSKFLAIGMSMYDVVEKSTVAPALQIGHPELGTLTPGAAADVTVLEYVERPCGLSDSGPTGYRIMTAPGRLINQVTIKDGAIRFDYDGRSKEDWERNAKHRPQLAWLGVRGLARKTAAKKASSRRWWRRGRATSLPEMGHPGIRLAFGL